MTARQTEPDDTDPAAGRQGLAARGLMIVLGLLGVAAIAYGTHAVGLWGGPSAAELAAQRERQQAEAADQRERRAKAAAQRNANAPMLSRPASAAAFARGASAAASAVLPQVSLPSGSEVRFNRPVASRVVVLSVSSVAFGNEQRMLQFALRATNEGNQPFTFQSRDYRLVTETQTLSPMDKVEEAVAPGASIDGLVTFVAGAHDAVRALRLVNGSEQQDLPLSQ